MPISPGRPESARAEASPGRPAVTWPEGPADKHSGQSELQSQRARCMQPSTCQDSESFGVAGALGVSPGGKGGAGQGRQAPILKMGWHPIRAYRQIAQSLTGAEEHQIRKLMLAAV